MAYQAQKESSARLSTDPVMTGLRHALGWHASDPRRIGDECTRRAWADADNLIRDAMAARRVEWLKSSAGAFSLRTDRA